MVADIVETTGGGAATSAASLLSGASRKIGESRFLKMDSSWAVCFRPRKTKKNKTEKFWFSHVCFTTAFLFDQCQPFIETARTSTPVQMTTCPVARKHILKKKKKKLQHCGCNGKRFRFKWMLTSV